MLCVENRHAPIAMIARSTVDAPAIQTPRNFAVDDGAGASAAASGCAEGGGSSTRSTVGSNIQR